MAFVNRNEVLKAIDTLDDLPEMQREVDANTLISRILLAIQELNIPGLRDVSIIKPEGGKYYRAVSPAETLESLDWLARQVSGVGWGGRSPKRT